jgi:hypothetical protein
MKDKRFNNVEMLKENRRELEYTRFEMEQERNSERVLETFLPPYLYQGEWADYGNKVN